MIFSQPFLGQENGSSFTREVLTSSGFLTKYCSILVAVTRNTSQDVAALKAGLLPSAVEAFASKLQVVIMIKTTHHSLSILESQHLADNIGSIVIETLLTDSLTVKDHSSRVVRL